MSPELITAIKERIALGRSREEIEAEVVATGYTPEQFSAAYEAATTPSSTQATSGLAPDTTYYARSTTGTLISTGDLVGQTWDLMKAEKGAFGAFVGFSLVALLGILVVCGGLFFVLGDDSFFGSIIAAYILFIISSGILYGALFRALLRRQNPAAFSSHVTWTLKNLLPLYIAGFMAIGAIYTGFVLLLVPGLMLAIYLSMAGLFIFDERARGLDALILSTKYIYGRFWPIFVRFFIVNLVLGLIYFAIIMIGAFTVFLLPIAIPLAIFAMYFGQVCAWVILYESLLKVGPVKTLPVSEGTLRITYTIIGSIGVFVFLGFIGWSMFDTVSELGTLFP
jgi:hypothetical protein